MQIQEEEEKAKIRRQEKDSRKVTRKKEEADEKRGKRCKPSFYALCILQILFSRIELENFKNFQTFMMLNLDCILIIMQGLHIKREARASSDEQQENGKRGERMRRRGTREKTFERKERPLKTRGMKEAHVRDRRRS